MLLELSEARKIIDNFIDELSDPQKWKKPMSERMEVPDGTEDKNWHHKEIGLRDDFSKIKEDENCGSILRRLD
jgi:hypothetical protein